jgi:hypothetical protein
MKNKHTPQSAFFTPRTLLALLLCSLAACSMVSGALLAFFRVDAPSKISTRTLTFAERVAYRRAIEEVYWRHRIWPKENSKPKPSLDEVMSAQQIQKKVEDYLRDSEALEDYWQKPTAPEQLQAEMKRMARNTKQPEVLRELFEALGNDPSVIAECLARPVLTERSVADLSAQDKGQLFALLRTQAAGSKLVSQRQANLPIHFPRLIRAPMTPGQPPVPTARPPHDAITRQFGPAAKWLSGPDRIATATFLTPAADTIPPPTVGRPPAVPTRPPHEPHTRRYGPAAK